MKGAYKQNSVTSGVTRFTRAPMADIEFSKMTSNPRVWTTFNAGDIVPIWCQEILPHDTFDMSMDFVVRQTTVLRPTMDNMEVDYYAFFVPNRIINDSWKNVQGENTSRFWTAPEVEIAPLYPANATADVQIPIGSIADYYGLPTQRPIKANVLKGMNDFWARGYLECYNTYFRDENYQAPVPYSKLNVYEGFLDPAGSLIQYDGSNADTLYIGFPDGQPSDGSYPKGAISKAVNGDGYPLTRNINLGKRLTSWSALDKPLKANKLHDFITSGLPSPQKGAEVYFGIGDQVEGDIVAGDTITELGKSLKLSANRAYDETYKLLSLYNDSTGSTSDGVVRTYNTGTTYTPDQASEIIGTNLRTIVDLSSATGISVNDLRLAVSTQQVYETLARGGSRYKEVISSFFGLDTENPFSDIPTKLGHVRRGLDLYQVAQTSGTQGANIQGELTAFGYTTNGGQLFNRTFLEHGFIHVFAIVRHRNVYSTFVNPSYFRRKTLDWYLPPLANIGEQPIRLATLNPFVEEDGRAIAFQEAWWDYRYDPDRVSGAFRSMPADRTSESLNIWTYADDFEEDFDVIDGEWLKSNSQEVLDRTLAVTSANAPQFKAFFSFRITKQRPMPTYSVPGLDII